MKKLFIISLLFSITLFAQPLKKVVLQLNWLNQFQFAGYYMAKEKGFYKKVGLDVQIKEYNNHIKLSKMSKNKGYDFAIGRSSLIIDKINGEDIVALAVIFQNSPLMLLTRKDSNINSPEDIRNKRVMITSDARNTASILAMLYSRKLYNSDFIIQKHSFNIDDLINKKTDAMASYLSNEPIIMKERGIDYKIIHPKDYGFDFYNDILFTSSKFIKNNPSLTKDFLDASLKGWHYAFENMAETSELIFKKYNTQNKTIVHFLKEGEILKKLAYHKEDGLIGCIEKDKLLEITNVFKVLGLVNDDLDVNSFVYEFNPHKTIVFELTSNQKNFFFLIFLFLGFLFLIVTILLNESKKAKELLHTVVNSTNDFIFYKDSDFKYIGCNNSFAKFVGFSKSKIINSNDYELFDAEFANIFREHDIKTLEKDEVQVFEQWVPHNGKKVLLQIKKIPFKYSKKKKKGVVGITRDITNLYRINEKLKEQTYLDELTGIYNRKAYNEKLSESLEHFRRYEKYFCLIMFDIDDFKVINDTYGHDKGDLVLKELTKIVNSSIRKTDIFFRVGGEEFIVLTPFCDEKSTYVIAEKIRKSVESMKIIKNREITVSLGLTKVKKDDDNDTLFKRVDELLYKSKHSGKNCISY